MTESEPPLSSTAAPSLNGVRVAGFMSRCPAPLARAFAEKVTVSGPELCRLLPMDRDTLRRHIAAGRIAFTQTGAGLTHPRKGFTLEAVMRFLEERSGVLPCRSSGGRGRRLTASTSGEEAGGFLATRARLIAEEWRQRSGEAPEGLRETSARRKAERHDQRKSR